MENASKALIIAAAILIAIVLISLGVMVLGQGSQLVKNADMSEVEISSFNSEFEQFIGTKVRGNVVRQLITKVDQHNRVNADDISKQIKLTNGDAYSQQTEEIGDTAPNNTVKTSDIETGVTYKVEVNYSAVGLISHIYINK